MSASIATAAKNAARAPAPKNFFQNFLQKFREPYIKASSYREYGLRADDLLVEESDVVQEAIRRLSPQEAYARVYRLRRAIHLSACMDYLPVNEQTKPEEDVHYLLPIIEQVEAEAKEREFFDNFIPARK